MNTKAKIKIAGGLLLLAVILVTIIPGAVSVSTNTDAANEIEPAAPQTNKEMIPGLVCFKYNNYADTWILAFEQTGPKEFIVSGYDSVLNSAMSGGGAIVSGKLLLSLDERGYNIYTTGGYGKHNIQINMAASPLTGVDKLAWFDINGVKKISYPAGLAFYEIACPSGTQPAATGKATTDK